MLRAPLRYLRQFCAAILVLAVLFCLAEIGLRLYDSHTRQISLRDHYDCEAFCKSWFTHHELKPLHRLENTDPDRARPVILRTNSLGLRGPEVAVPKPPGIYRIVCLGDEQTLAGGVDERETFASRLQQYLQTRSTVKIEVINAGTPDYCPLLSCLQFRHKLLGLQPDLVVLNWDMSDVGDDFRYRRLVTMSDDQRPLSCSHPALEVPSNPRLEKVQEALLIPAWTRQRLGKLWVKNVLPGSDSDIDSPLAKYRWLDDNPPDWTIYIRQSLEPTAELQQLAAGAYADFVVATAPKPWQVSARASAGSGVRSAAGVGEGIVYRSRRPFELIADQLAERRIPFCDISPAFTADAQSERLFFQNEAALSPAGHDLYARALAGFVLRNCRGPWTTSNPAPHEGPVTLRDRETRR